METKLSQDESKFKKWAEFCLKYNGDFWRNSKFEADFIQKKKDDQNDDDYLKSMIELMFRNIAEKDKKVKMFLHYSQEPIDTNCRFILCGGFARITTIFGHRDPNFDFDRYALPNMYIFKAVLGFISVLSWVGIGYFVAAIQSRESKLKFLANIIASIFDTAFIISLIFGAPLFSVPMILAGIVSFVLRIIFVIHIGKNISKKKQKIKHDNGVFDEINVYLGQYMENPPGQKDVGQNENEKHNINQEMNTQMNKNTIGIDVK